MSRRRWIPSWPLALAVFSFWLLMNARVDAPTVAMALLLAIVVPPFAARLDREFARIGRLRGIPKLIAVLLFDIVHSNIVVARQVLGKESKINPGFLWVPLDIGNIHGIAALTGIITLTPGTVTATLSEDRRHLLVHVLNLEDPEALIAEIKRRYEAPLMEIFP